MRITSKSIILAIILLFSLCDTAPAQQRGFGTGMILGEPTGISIKNWIGYSKAIDFAIAWSFEGNNSLTIHADYLNHNFKLIHVEKGSLPLFYGIGGRVRFNDHNGKDNDDIRFGVRVPVGLAYLFENVTLDLFTEIVPILDLVPETDFKLNAAVGIRFFFK
ncbi:MAG: BAPKO_0422 family outer member beta-barrel protein [bacterium]